MASDSSSRSSELGRNVARRHPRYIVDLALQISFRRGGEKVVSSGRASELSEGGVAAYIFTDLGVGDSLVIEATLPYSSKPIALDAVIRSRLGFRYGLEFKDLNTQQKRALTRACSTLSVL